METSTNQCSKAWADANWLFKLQETIAEEDLCLYYSRENYQAWDCPIKASTSKLHKVRNVSTSAWSKVEDAESENEDVQPQ
jgi:hypothetical protein